MTQAFNPRLILEILHYRSGDFRDIRYTDDKGVTVSVDYATKFAYTEVLDYDYEEYVPLHVRDVVMDFDFKALNEFRNNYYKSVSPFGLNDGRYLCMVLKSLLNPVQESGSAGDILVAIRKDHVWNFDVNPYLKYEADAYVYEDMQGDNRGTFYVTTSELPQDWEI